MIKSLASVEGLKADGLIRQVSVSTRNTVLVIDDEEAIREAVEDILSLYGVPVVAAANGEQGLALFATHQATIGLVLLDLTLPGLKGEVVYYHLQEINPNVPIIISSGYRQQSLGLTLPSDVHFLPKPYDLTKLMDTVRRFLPPKP